jgi:hypothetical protein
VGNFHTRVLEVDGMRICRVRMTSLTAGDGGETAEREGENGRREA